MKPPTLSANIGDTEPDGNAYAYVHLTNEDGDLLVIDREAVPYERFTDKKDAEDLAICEVCERVETLLPGIEWEGEK